MKQLEDYSDERNKGFCIHCGAGLSDGPSNKEHVPTRFLLDRPFPADIRPVYVHKDCNADFSLDEEYVGAFRASVICGSTEPDPQQFAAAARALERGPGLRRRIDRCRSVQRRLWGAPEIQWTPEIERVKRVMVKNAKGHAFYELGEPMLAEPSSVGMSPMSRLPPNQREEFENGVDSSLWPEVGSRLMQHMAIGGLQPGGWIEVQPRVYRYAVSQESGGVLVRMVLREYLAAEILWDEPSIA